MPTTSAIDDLERLAARDPAVAPLARLQVVALRAAEEPGWTEGVPNADMSHAASTPDVTPFLHGRTLLVDPDRQRALLRDLASTLGTMGSAAAGALGALFAATETDVLGLLAASVTHDQTPFEALASGAGIEQPVVEIVAHLSALPVLLACGRRAEAVVKAQPWPHGFCPVCAAWPTLAEIRGLARDLFLRCGRCGSGWRYERGGCVFCGNRDHQSQGYFAAERERESRKVVTCDACHGYLKTLATLGPLGPAALLFRDLDTLELDVAALENGYARPDTLGCELAVRVEPAPRRAPTGGRSKWRWWG